MDVSRVCYESASAVANEARRRRIEAWAAEMRGVSPDGAQDLAKCFDQTVEFDAYLAEQEADEAYDLIAPHLRGIEIRTLADVPGKLPVFPAAAREVMRLAVEPESTLSGLEHLAKADAVLAGAVISSANSSLFGARQPITELRRAIAHLGTDLTRNVLLAAAMRPFFASARLRPLWVHSLDTAQTADRIAQMAGVMPSGEAFLTGLVHDIGRLAFLLAPADVTSRADRLLAAGCPVAAVERALFGADHAQFGALILGQWKFDARMIEAARFHHRPERSSGVHAALIYLAEFRGDADEDIPSFARLKSACGALQVDITAATGVAFDQARAFSHLTN
jgi:HD-like signal output (HDOD) protein